ncbi:hypothetical protein [Pseudomonas sp. Leaf129]|uniref:hypothetical protein n=1 Tax=Pseudomonas sp. Leaf129 TaxID=1736268 RepID=UPI0012E76675|nr:hypothetical protein [Pseudomonas sp. Leaf129]
MFANYALAVLCLVSGMARGAEALITAEVRNGTIANTTPRALFCSFFAQGSFCWSPWSVNLPLTYYKSINLETTNVREMIYVRAPQVMTIQLINQTTHETAKVVLRTQYISQRASHSTHRVMSASVTGVNGCQSMGPHYNSTQYTRHLWTIPAGACYSRPTAVPAVEESYVSELGMTFYPEFPKPESLSPGLWEGVVTNRIGPAGEFDFGEIYGQSADTLDVRVQLTVKHDIRVDMPAANTQVALLPPRGWYDYNNHKVIPERLFKDLPIRVWAASTFAVYLECQYPYPPRCRLMPNSPHARSVNVEVALSLPGPFSYNGQPVTRLELQRGSQNARLITPSGSASNQPGTVHLEIQQNVLRQMLNFPGTTYSGTVTIVFDANP